MTNRESSPNAAFAWVGKINDVTFKLFRHHKLDTVKDGNEHDTVDYNLLSACMKMVDQAPVSAKEREAIAAHLAAHANFNRDVTDPKTAEKIVNQKDAGSYKIANETLNDTEMTLPADPNFVPDTKADKVETSTVKAQTPPEPKAPIANPATMKAGLVQQDGDLPQGNPNQEGIASDKPSPDSNGGDGKQIVTDDNAVVQSNPNQDKIGKASLIAEEDKKKVNSADQTVKSQDDLPDSSFAVIEKGGKKDKEGKTVPRSYRHLPYKDASGKIDLPHLRNALARMNQIQASSPKDSTERIRAAAKKVLVAAAKKSLPNTKFSKSNVSEDKFNAEEAVAEIDALVVAAKAKKKAAKKKEDKHGPGHKDTMPHSDMISYNVYLGKENKIIISKENIDGAELLATAYGPDNAKEFAGLIVAADLNPPSPEEQNQGGAVLTDDADVQVSNPNTDKIGLASLVTTNEEITKEGHKFIVEQLKAAISGKTIAKLWSADMTGSVEMMNLQVGDNQDFPMTIMMDVSKDAQGNVRAIKIWNDYLPGEVLADLGKFITTLSKDVVVPANASAVDEKGIDKATAPVILEKCKSDVLSQKIKTFTKKNGHPPGAKERKSMESSAYAICNASLKRAGKL